MGWLALGDAVLCAGLLAPFMPREGVGLLVGRGLRGGLEWVVVLVVEGNGLFSDACAGSKGLCKEEWCLFA